MNEDRKLPPFVRGFLFGVCGFLLLFGCLPILHHKGYDLLISHFLAGFWFFLRDNLPAMSFDAGTWGPGLVAFLAAMLLAHRFLSAWAAKTYRHWSFLTTFCLALTVPVLFVISFIVPGVLLQWEMLRQVPWLDLN